MVSADPVVANRATQAPSDSVAAQSQTPLLVTRYESELELSPEGCFRGLSVGPLRAAAASLDRFSARPPATRLSSEAEEAESGSGAVAISLAAGARRVCAAGGGARLRLAGAASVRLAIATTASVPILSVAGTAAFRLAGGCLRLTGFCL
eukprot:CAMPEP_0179875588 /NCGR_PEP_ID=MMETSP0982-20121206/23633_1 /TAXON_ID=483367 /ORGANISM="non described non described, Strain CCMP 2436" /LENGTH=149 /DNA_ID=CAMNT_0021767723 /DNA_START=161 /DNA_END=609 /DNA_ORIENTATION=-